MTQLNYTNITICGHLYQCLQSTQCELEIPAGWRSAELCKRLE